MPSTYAHYAFASEVLKGLTGQAKRAAEANKTLYFTGCHGPDILFYYKPVKANRINELGYGMHGLPAAPFFERARDIVAQRGDGALAYALGFVTHFALDSTCHGYVESERKLLGITHTKLEVEFDRYLLSLNGVERPEAVPLTRHIYPDKAVAAEIAPFFSLTEGEIVRSLKDMRRICNLFVCPGRVKRAIVGGVLRMMSDELPDQIMGLAPDPVCAESNERMLELYQSALTTAAELCESFMACLEGGRLDRRFDRNYE